MLRIKRVYEKRDSGDGKRILVDRLWPRGLTREEAAIYEWMKDLAPSDELRKWFGHEPEKWAEFRQKYTQELNAPDKVRLLDKLASMARGGNVTLVYAARDTEHNNAQVLEEILQSVEVLQQ
jgi:uncharacterized protein YeaO (DUF488 family)